MRDTITIDSVFLRYGKHEVLRGAYLKLEQRRVVGLLGRNGCGKSSLLKVLTGQLSAQNKAVLFNGRYLKDVFKVPGLINYLPQHDCHPRSLSLSRTLRFYGVDEVEFAERYPFFNGRLLKRLGELSGGELRLFEVLTVLEAETKFTILDEPFSHIMPVHVDMLQERITQLKARKGILVTDHHYERVLDVADDLAVMVGGTIRPIAGREGLRKYGYLR